MTYLEIVLRKEAVHYKRMWNFFNKVEFKGFFGKIIAIVEIVILTLFHYAYVAMHSSYEFALFLFWRAAFKGNMLKLQEKLPPKKMTKREMLRNIRADRPEQTIHKVLWFKRNDLGFYDVMVDMEAQFLETKVRHVHEKLPYPLSKYTSLPEGIQMQWRMS